MAIKRTKKALEADARYKALGKGERTSHKVSLITKADGTRFKRKNANQYGDAEGGNDYTEKRIEHSDIFADGGGVGKKLNWRAGESLSGKDYYYGYNNGTIYSTEKSNLTKDLKIIDVELVFEIKSSNFFDNEQTLNVKKEMKKIFSELDAVEINKAIDDKFEEGGTTTGFEYSIGGL